MTQGQEVEFHEIKIQLFQEFKFLIMRSKFNLFMRSNVSNNIDQEVEFFDHEMKTQNSIISNFDLMIDLLATSAIMRSNVFLHR